MCKSLVSYYAIRRNAKVTVPDRKIGDCFWGATASKKQVQLTFGDYPQSNHNAFKGAKSQKVPWFCHPGVVCLSFGLNSFPHFFYIVATFIVALYKRLWFSLDIFSLTKRC